ncbi:MAG: hypothetical protein M1812_007863 [Candelaria pacifica]|nr:MAG: hypothetical protein M1812_007863 [Candelaria pacifica]
MGQVADLGVALHPMKVNKTTPDVFCFRAPTSQDPSQPSETSSDLSHISRHQSYDPSSNGEEYPFNDETDTYETMILHNKRFLCAILHVLTPEKNKTAEASARAEEERELARATDRG